MLALALTVERPEARPGQLGEPDDVGWQDEVPGRAQYMQSQDLAAVEGRVEVGAGYRCAP